MARILVATRSVASRSCMVRQLRASSGPAKSSDKEKLAPGRAWDEYLRLLDERPILTKAATAGVVNGIGDLSSQLVLEGGGNFDAKRLAIFTAHNACLFAPTLHVWYGLLERAGKRAAGRWGTSSSTVAVAKMAADQFLFAPIALGVFLSVLWTLEGRPEDVRAHLLPELPGIVLSNWKVGLGSSFVSGLPLLGH